jgi:hypothetical protein
MDELYFFWSLERTATVYGVRTIGTTEWYPWAAGFLVNAQGQDGSWHRALAPPIGTCFALLVLRRTNLAEDLTATLPKRITIREPREAPPGLTTRPGPIPSGDVTTKPGRAPLEQFTEKLKPK